MESSLFSIFTKKIVSTVIGIGSLFYSTISGVSASFTEIQISTKGPQLIIATRLENCFTEDLDQIFHSGKEININFKIELFSQDNKDVLRDTSFIHSIKYSQIDRVFDVYRSTNQESYKGLNLQEAKDVLTELENIHLVHMDQLESGVEYFFQITAWMDKIILQGMEEPLNLMYFWNSIRPVGRSDTFSKDIFQY